MPARPEAMKIEDEDHAAIAAACEPGVGLCTIVGIDGGFSRRVGAQLAVRPDRSTVGSMADGCLEAQLASDIGSAEKPEVVRYGQGSSTIDFRLPCGGGLDILVDPQPDRAACKEVMAQLHARHAASMRLHHDGKSFVRTYLPRLQVAVFGEGPELARFRTLCAAMNIATDARAKDDLFLGQPARGLRLDPWTAVLLLFHDHEWEAALLEQVLAQDPLYIGAQGGERSRENRAATLAARGISDDQIARIRSPVGMIPACKSPDTLALSAVAEIVSEYERMRDSD